MTGYILYAIGLFYFFMIVYFSTRDFVSIESRWQHYFDKIQYSAQDLYAAIEAELQSREVKGIDISRLKVGETELYSNKREYLRVARGDFMYLFCAAPFGTGYFVSWWFGNPSNMRYVMVAAIPIIGPFLAKYIFKKSYYEMDTDAMFKEVVRLCINKGIEKMTEEKGIRGLTELELAPIDPPKRFNR